MTRSAWTRAALLLALVLGLYLPTLRYAFVLDDFIFIARNPAVTQGAPLRAYLTDRSTTSSDEKLRTQVYRPLRAAAFRAIAATLGVHPPAYRAANLILYGLAAVLVLGLLTQITGDPRASLLGAALWVAAPVHVESVVYASALGDQLSLALELSALLTGLRCLRAAPPARVAWGALSVALAALSMLAKEMAITEAGLLALLGLAVLGWDTMRRAPALLLLGGHGAVTLGFLALRTAVLGQVGQVPMTGAALLRGLAQAGVLLGHYLWICVAPLGHCAAYVMPAPSPPAMAGGLLAVAAALLLALRSGRPAVWLGLLWFVVGLVPVLQLVPVLADLADRFALVPSIGLGLLWAAGLSALPRWSAHRGASRVAITHRGASRVAITHRGASRVAITHRGASRVAIDRLGTVFTIAVLVVLCAGTLIESRPWQSDDLLWRHAVDIEPESGQAHGNLGVVLLHEGDPERALRELDRAQALGRDAAEVDLRRAMALDALGRREPALAAVRVALRKDPRLGRAHALYGDLLRQAGLLADARRELVLAQQQAPEHPSTSLLAAVLAQADGRRSEAVRIYAGLAAGNPREARFQYMYARAALEAGEARTALEAARACAAISPEDPQCAGLLGRSLLAAGGAQAEARAALDRALAGLPEGPERQDCLAARAALPK